MIRADRAVFPALLLALLLLLPAPTFAANWPLIQGTEEGREEVAFKPFVFLQPRFEATWGEPVEGLQTEALRPFEGRIAAFNVVGADDATETFRIARARLGARGTVPGTGRAVNWLLSVEAGQNALTDGGRTVTLVDASATLTTPLGPRIRVGQFKLPLMDEVTEAFHVTSDLIAFSPVAGRLLMERPVVDGEFVGAGYGFRDMGAQLFDSYLSGKLEWTWAGWVTNGRAGGADFSDGVDLGGWTRVSWLLDGRRFHPERDEIGLWAWGLTGRREVEPGEPEGRHRAGVGAEVRKAPVRVRVEFAAGEGAIPAGPRPPFQGQPNVLLGETARGANLLTGLRVLPWLEANLALHHLRLAAGEGPAERRITEAVFGLQGFASSHAKLALNLTLPRIDAPAAPRDVQRIVHTAAPRLALQATVRF